MRGGNGAIRTIAVDGVAEGVYRSARSMMVGVMRLD